MFVISTRSRSTESTSFVTPTASSLDIVVSDERRRPPTTRYPLSRRNLAKYAPSCPVTPVTSAVLVKMNPLRRNHALAVIHLKHVRPTQTRGAEFDDTQASAPITRTHDPQPRRRYQQVRPMHRFLTGVAQSAFHVFPLLKRCTSVQATYSRAMFRVGALRASRDSQFVYVLADAH